MPSRPAPTLAFLLVACLACGGEGSGATAAPSAELTGWARAQADAAAPMVSDALERSEATLGMVLNMASMGRPSGQLLAPRVKEWLLGDLCADPRYVRCALELGVAAEGGARARMTGPHHGAASAAPEGPAIEHTIETTPGPLRVQLTAEERTESRWMRLRFEKIIGEGVVTLDLIDAGAPAAP
ncbi:MAG: hypothetical protein AAGH15_20420 [Myxococcota bacterium]